MNTPISIAGISYTSMLTIFLFMINPHIIRLDVIRTINIRQNKNTVMQPSSGRDYGCSRR